MKSAKAQFAADSVESSVDDCKVQRNDTQADQSSLRDIRNSSVLGAESLENFKTFYDKLDKSTLNRAFLETVYTQDIAFEDPFHQINGLDALHSYFAEMYENVKEISFDWIDSSSDGRQAFITWTMSYSHPFINRGKPVQVNGVSRLVFKDGRVSSHRDYFDGGQMLYEHIPALGMIVRKLKKRLA